MAEIVIMDFSGIYKEEQFFEGEKVSWLDVREIPGTNCYCDDEAKTQILEKLDEIYHALHDGGMDAKEKKDDCKIMERQRPDRKRFN